MEDKYIGLLLALSGSLAIGSSFIITKKGLNDTAARNNSLSNASDNLAYLRNPIWWAGISTLVLGEVANFAAYTFAAPILVTPLGAFSVLIGAVLASIFLGEELGHLGRVGCTLCLLGSLIIVLHAPEDKEVATVDEILNLAAQPGFLLYCSTVLIFSLIMIYRVSPRYGKKNPMVYISICSLVGSISIMAIKGFGIALKLTIAGNNQLTHLSTYVFAIVIVFCIMVQMNYFNKALDTFSTNVVNPMYYVGFSTATIVASLILFQGFNTSDYVNILSLLAGFVVTFLGVHLLNLSRASIPPGDNTINHTVFEGGLMNPRVSVSGRLSNDSAWSGHGLPYSAGHGRRSSLYRSQDAQLYHAFEEDSGGMGLELLREEDEDDASDERTRLTVKSHDVRHERITSPERVPNGGLR
ncbi:hypothetical protein BS47DRAFT_1342290 [Hydnum rufescens UP504]|uniref:Magnesium transporter n=1 Tax=Hydnum rufescens UP504 TaxID=1448309 RepID=A0A9P6B2I1_9AGAM|nr:hypothetical protein BS47DRAFT_1342290 [Hydnum rufescens UP504]